MPLPTVEPYLYIDAPEVEPYAYGLFGAAHPLTLTDEHWIGFGVEWESLASYAAALYPAGVLTCQQSNQRTVNDAVTTGTNSSGVVTSATAVFSAADVGKRISNAQFPPGTTIATYTSPTSVTMSVNAAAAGTGEALTIFENGGIGGTKVLPSVVPTTKAFPFTVYGGVLCGSVGYTDAEATARALKVVELAGQHAAENALWTGAGGNSPGLNASTSTTVNGTAAKVSLQIARLERWLANNYNGRGFIHMTRDVALLAGRDQLLLFDEINENAKTRAGTRVIMSGGGDGTGPSAAAPATDQAWCYATGLVTVTRSSAETPANLGQALNRSTNQVQLLAEQEYMIGIDGPIGAALVGLTL